MSKKDKEVFERIHKDLMQQFEEIISDQNYIAKCNLAGFKPFVITTDNPRRKYL